MRSGHLGLVPRVVPPVLFGGRRAARLVERNAMVYRRIWLILVSGFFEPLFYLLSIGVGVGELVGDITLPDGRIIDYTAFVAPALLASSAMNGAVYDSTFNVFDKLKWKKIYDAVLATPLGAGDVALGEISWALIRGLIYATAFLIVMLAMGLVLSPWAVLALPAAVLIGFAFAAVRHGRHDLHAHLARLRVGPAGDRCRCSCSRRRSTRCPPTGRCCSGWCGSRPCTRVSPCCGASRPATWALSWWSPSSTS